MIEELDFKCSGVFCKKKNSCDRHTTKSKLKIKDVRPFILANGRSYCKYFISNNDTVSKQEV